MFTKRDNKNLSPRGVGNFIFEIALFAMFGALMFASKKIMEVIPNVHLLGMFIMVLTVVFRVKALIPIYLYIMLDGLFGGFGMWWIPYLYIWAVLWGITMLLPKNIPPKIAAVVYPLICALHGLAFGTSSGAGLKVSPITSTSVAPHCKPNKSPSISASSDVLSFKFPR